MKTIIETERLMLREMSFDDYDAIYKVLADSDIMKHYPYTFDEDRVRGWIAKNIERYQQNGFGLWAVCLKESGEVIGDCGLTLQNINGEIKPEIGYHIRADKQRLGYGRESAIAVRNWAFENTDFDMVYSYMNADNLPSVKTAMSYGARIICEYTNEYGVLTAVYGAKRFLYNIVNISDKPELIMTACKWFSEKWNVPYNAYFDSVNESLNKEGTVPQWYLCLYEDKIIGGMGVIDNDFHKRKDLTPNICAVYTEPEYRCQGVAGEMLNFVCEDMKNRGINTLYLITDYTSFYERYGWKYLCDVECDSGETSRLYIHK